MSLIKTLLPVVVGALLGYIPAFISVTTQIRHQEQEAKIGRRLDALKDVTRACNQLTDDFRAGSEFKLALQRLERRVEQAKAAPNRSAQSAP